MRIAIKDVAAEVYDYGQALSHEAPEEEGGDVRLQVDGEGWAVHTGDAQYDTDHRGAWGAAWVPWGCTRGLAREIAKDLIAQAREQMAEEED